jgi:hypothetical protein
MKPPQQPRASPDTCTVVAGGAANTPPVVMAIITVRTLAEHTQR